MEESTPFAAIEYAPQAVIVTVIVSQILDEHAVERLRSTLGSLLDEESDKAVVLDFTQVRTLCSSAIGILLVFKKHLDDRKIKLKICCIQDKIKNTPHDKFIYEIFKVSKLDEFFDLAPSVPAALKSLDALPNRQS